MNIFIENIKTAEEAVNKLSDRGILTSDGQIDCCTIAADIEELKNTPASKKEQVLQEIREVGITSWNLGRGYLPRWDINKKDFERALEKKFS